MDVVKMSKNWQEVEEKVIKLQFQVEKLQDRVTCQGCGHLINKEGAVKVEHIMSFGASPWYYGKNCAPPYHEVTYGDNGTLRYYSHLNTYEVNEDGSPIELPEMSKTGGVKKDGGKRSGAV